MDTEFDEIILASQIETRAVIKCMVELIGRYGFVTVGDLYKLIGIESNYADEKRGWIDADTIGVAGSVKRVRNGYLLDLPKPISLKEKTE
jgi:hypothetical protein